MPVRNSSCHSVRIASSNGDGGLPLRTCILSCTAFSTLACCRLPPLRALCCSITTSSSTSRILRSGGCGIVGHLGRDKFPSFALKFPSQVLDFSESIGAQRPAPSVELVAIARQHHVP